MQSLRQEPGESGGATRTTYDPSYIRTLFDTIAPRYDFLNHLLSLSLDVRWRRRAIDLLRQYKPRRVLDVATGTADLAIEASKLHPELIRGVDISREMIRLGREKIARRGLLAIITLEQGSAESLRFADQSFDTVTVAFGVRNFTDLARGLSEMHRVLRPGGVALILEFSRPRQSPFKEMYGFYFKKILPIVGGMVSRSREAYEYLPHTVGQFPDGEELLNVIAAAGFTQPRQYPLTFGIATIYLAEKPDRAGKS